MDEMWICIIMCVRPQCSSSSLAQGECLCLVSVSLAHCALRPSGYSWGQNGRKHTHSQIHTLVQTLFFFFFWSNIPRPCPPTHTRTHTHPVGVWWTCGCIAFDLPMPRFFIDKLNCHRLIISSSVSATDERFLILFNLVRNLARKTRNQ